MKSSISGFPVLILAAALSMSWLPQAAAVPAFIPISPVTHPDVVHVGDTSLSRDGARIIRRDRHRKHRVERHERRHERVQKSAKRHHNHKKLAQRRHDGHRYAYNQRPDRQYLYQFGNGAQGYSDNRRIRRFDEAYGGDNHYRHYRKPRIYRMESFGYNPKPQAPLKDILTAVPD